MTGPGSSCLNSPSAPAVHLRADPAAKGDLLRLAGDALAPTLVRATALSLLGRHPGPDVTAAFRSALLDQEPLLRRTAVAEAPIADQAERVARLAPLLGDPFRAALAERMAALDPARPEAAQPRRLAAGR